MLSRVLTNYTEAFSTINNIAGATAAGFPARWKSMPVVHPVIISPSHVYSFISLLDSVTSDTTVSILSNSISKVNGLNRLMGAIAVSSNMFLQARNLEGLSFDEQISVVSDYDEAMSGVESNNESLKVLFSLLRKARGGSAVKEYLRASAALKVSDQRVIKQVLSTVRNRLDTCHSSFELTKNIILSCEEYPDNTGNLYHELEVSIPQNER